MLQNPLCQRGDNIWACVQGFDRLKEGHGSHTPSAAEYEHILTTFFERQAHRFFVSLKQVSVMRAIVNAI